MTIEPSTAAAPEQALTFDSMALSAPLARAVREVGYVKPTSVQHAAFMAVAAGRDVVVQARTGSGKTAAFALPLLDRVVKAGGGAQVLVLCPTRELAGQVAGEFVRLGKYLELRCAAVYGGAGMQRQIDELAAGAEIIAGTPGRVLDHLKRGTMDVSRLRAIVLDEADEMLSMGFAEEMNNILDRLPKQRQGLFFSATMPDDIQRMARKHLREPEQISLSSDGVSPTEIDHFVYYVGMENRVRSLARVLEIEKPDAAIVFCNTREETSTVARELKRLGLTADYINGELEQAERERVLGSFRERRIKVLVATDVAARGIDVTHVTHVINFGFPEQAETYVHRTGRTGRAGRRGTAISLFGPADVGSLYYLRLTYGIRPVDRTLPTAAEERTRREMERVELLQKTLPRKSGDEFVALARRLMAHDDGERLLAAVLENHFEAATRAALRETAASPVEPAPAPRPAPVYVPPPPPVVTAPVAHVAPAPAAEPEAPRPPRRPRAESAPVRTVTEDAPAPSPVVPARTEGPAPRKITVRHDDGSALDESVEGEGMEEMRLNVGRREGVRTGELARLIREKTGLARRDVGRISVRDRFSVVEIRAELIERALEALKDEQFGETALAPERSVPSADDEA